MTARLQSTRQAGTQSINRAITVLRCVASLPREDASLASVIRMTGLNRTTAFRLLQCLSEERMLTFDLATKTYGLGQLAIELGIAGGGFEHLGAPWRDGIRRIALQTGMTAYLVARSGTEVVCLESHQAQTALRAVTLVTGQRLPLGIGAGSLAMLAAVSDEEIESVLLANAAQRAAQRYPVPRDELLRRIARTRAKGYSYSEQSVSKGVVGLGVAIPQEGEIVRLAASVSKVGERMQDGEQMRVFAIIRQELGLDRESDDAP